MTLENKVGQEKPDWKQWVPLLGIFQYYIDLRSGKPVIGEKVGVKEASKALVMGGYQAASLLGTTYLLLALADKF